MTPGRRAALALCSLTALSGCVSPAGDAAAYEAKAALTAADATSSVRTALLAVRTYRLDDLPGAYLEVVLVESEAAVGAVQTTFDSVQPPDDDRADRLRGELDELLSQSSAGLADLRIAARRDEPVILARTAAELADTAGELDAFRSEHQS